MRHPNYNRHGNYDPKVARVWDDYTESHLPYVNLIDKSIYGELTKIGTQDPVQNLEWDFLYFEDSSVFAPAANYFTKVKEETGRGEYCPYLEGTVNYVKWWKEEWRRCTEGYEVGGVWIPGEFYFYLNYCRITRVINEKTGEVGEFFPRFLLMDFYWFLELDACENPEKAINKQHLAMAKSRRLGFSFKQAAGCSHKFFFFKESTCIIGSEYGEKSRNTFEMALTIIDFVNEYTEFRTPLGTRKVSDNGCIVVAGAKVKVRGKEFFRGRKSRIITVSFHNKPDAAAGYGAVRVIFEESGMIKQFKNAWAFTEPTLRSGAIKKGVCIAFGTGGDMDGATRDFAEAMYLPGASEFKAYNNVYEYNPQTSDSGLFFDALWFREGAEVTLKDGSLHKALDNNGNPIRWVAELSLNAKRLKLKEATKKAKGTFLTQNCKTLSEAFLVLDGAVFPTEEVSDRINVLRNQTATYKPYVYGNLVETQTGVNFKPDLSDKVRPMNYFPLQGNESMEDLRGCVIQYYAPQTVDGQIPDDAYIIGHDPYAVEGSVHIDTGTSLGVAYVMRTNKYIRELGIPGVIVASYIGREQRSDDFNYNLYKLARYYNAKIMFENNRGQVKQYFQHKRALHMLCQPPGHVIDKHISKSTSTTRKFGYTTVNKQFKEELIRYVIDWLLSPALEGEGKRLIDTILDEALLQEMLRFSFEHGNYDRIMALVGCILYLENHKIHKTVAPKPKPLSFLSHNPYLFDIEKLNHANKHSKTQNISTQKSRQRRQVGSSVYGSHFPGVFGEH